MTKSTTTELHRRVDAVTTLLLQGASRSDIMQFATKKWGVTERQIDTYIAKARAAITSVLEEQRRVALAEHIGARRLLRKLAFDAGDYRLALECLRDEAKLWGLYDADILQRIEHLEELVKGTE